MLQSMRSMRRKKLLPISWSNLQDPCLITEPEAFVFHFDKTRLSRGSCFLDVFVKKRFIGKEGSLLRLDTLGIQTN